MDDVQLHESAQPLLAHYAAQASYEHFTHLELKVLLRKYPYFAGYRCCLTTSDKSDDFPLEFLRGVGSSPVVIFDNKKF